MRRILVAAMIGVVLLTGCTTNDETVPVDTVVATPTATVVQHKKASVKKKVPIISEGEQYGWLKINQIEKVRIADWKNSIAMQNNIAYSYSINITLAVSKYSGTIKCEPVLVRGKKDISSVCSVGWTGFPTEAVLYGENKGTIEVGFQPEQKVQKGDKFVLRLYGDNGLEFDDVVISNKALRNAKIGPKALNAGDVKQIKSVNGGEYSLAAKTVHFEEHAIPNANYDDNANYFDIKYWVSALKAPTNDRYVKTWTLYKGKTALVNSFVIGLDTERMSKLNYQSEPDVERLLYSDAEDVEKYVNNASKLPVGMNCDVWTNRLADEMNAFKPEYVRLVFEFPEEAKARNLSEKLRFNGRFTVYRVKVTDRKLKKKYRN